MYILIYYSCTCANGCQDCRTGRLSAQSVPDRSFVRDTRFGRQFSHLVLLAALLDALERLLDLQKASVGRRRVRAVDRRQHRQSDLGKRFFIKQLSIIFFILINPNR